MANPKPLRAPSLAGITPDEARMLRRRQAWRARVLHICLDALEGLADDDGLWPAATRPPHDALTSFLAVSDLIRRDMQRLLETEMVVPKLEGHRHAINYFLDNVIVYVRDQASRRSQALGRDPTTPLMSLSPEELREGVREALRLSSQAVGVLLHELVALERFEIEIQSQRKRLQVLLGCDKSLRELAASNADIIDAPLPDFERIVERFFAICTFLKGDLQALLARSSPYPALYRELTSVQDRLRGIITETIAPLERLRQEVAVVDAPLRHVHERLDTALAGAERLARQPIVRAGDGKAAIPLVDLLKLRTLLTAWRRDLGALTPELADRARASLEAQQRRGLLDEAAGVRAHLVRCVEAVTALDGTLVEPFSEVARRAEVLDGRLQPEALRDCLNQLRRSLERLQDGILDPARNAVVSLRERNALALKERICQELGKVRATFLQPSFAHIAAEDPRSTQTPRYFYLKEFAEEAQRSQQLLEHVYGLWRYMEELQQTRIEGLEFSPRNLGKIAERLLRERRSIPAGPGWSELAAFLASIKDRLVPRLQLLCALPGVRYDDREEIARFADRLTESCSALLAQRDTAYRLLKEIARLSDGHDGGAHDRYREIILEVSCREMAHRLRAVSTALLELTPYVGAMAAGIRMRTSLAFSRESGSGAPPPRRPQAAEA